jgi:hypothetical protein
LVMSMCHVRLPPATLDTMQAAAACHRLMATIIFEPEAAAFVVLKVTVLSAPESAAGLFAPKSLSKAIAAAACWGRSENPMIEAVHITVNPNQSHLFLIFGFVIFPYLLIFSLCLIIE